MIQLFKDRKVLIITDCTKMALKINFKSLQQDLKPFSHILAHLLLLLLD